MFLLGQSAPEVQGKVGMNTEEQKDDQSAWDIVSEW